MPGKSALQKTTPQQSTSSSDVVRARRPALSAIATRNNPLGQGTQAPPAGNSVTYCTQHTILADCSDLRLMFGNWQFSASGAAEADGANNISVRASIELTKGGTRRTFHFNGTRTSTIEPGLTTTTDPMAITLHAGDTIWIWTNVSIASGTWPIGLQIYNTNGPAANTPYPTINSQEGSNFSANTGDTTLTGTVAAQSMNCYSPVAILGHTLTPRPTVAIIGDSIAAGFGDTWTYDFGFIVRALQAGGLNYLNFSHKGETGTLFSQYPNAIRRTRALEFCTHAIEQYGTNDLATNTQTGLQVAQQRVNIWRALAGRGQTVWATTITPRTTSTDSWATTTNQTIVAGCGQPRTDLNVWLRAGAPVDPTTKNAVAVGTSGAIPCPYLAGVFDVAATVESGTSGLWAASTVLTTDGVHPNAAGHAAMAAAIDPTKFAV